MDFGLGLILSFTDNATAGINNAVNSLNRLTGAAQGALGSLDKTASLSALSVVAGQLGSSFTSAGGRILGMFSNLLGNVQRTGSEFESFRITLNAVYGDAEKAEQAIGKLLDFSIESPFEVEGVKDMLVLLQSQGIDAFNDIQGAITNTRQESLAWIADLMAFKPEEATMRWKRALTNYIGSGQDLMLRNILDMGDIEQILGHQMGSTVEERMNDIVEIVEKKGLTGLAKNLSTTWSGVASNVADAWTKFYKAIADNDVFDNLKGSFMSLSGAILSMSNEDLEAFGKTVAEGLNMIVEPLSVVTDKVNSLIQSIVDIAKTRPGVVKLGMAIAAIAGVVLISIGVFLKATSALSGLSLMYIAFGKQFGSLATLFRVGATKILGTLIPLTLAIGLLYTVWKNDLGGIATSVKTFVENIVHSFNTAKSSVSGSLIDMRDVLGAFDTQHSFFDGLTLALMRVMTLGKALVEGWNNYTLSYDTYQKVEALGIRPLVEGIFNLKYRFDHFVQGFKEGFGTVLKNVREFFEGLTESADGTIFDSLLDGVTRFFQLLSNNDPEAWTRFGDTIGNLAAKALVLFTTVKIGEIAFNTINGAVKKVAGVFTILKGAFSTLLTPIKLVFQVFKELQLWFSGGVVVPSPITSAVLKVISVFQKLWSVVSTVIGAIKGVILSLSTAIGVPVALVGAVIIGAVLSVIAFAVTHWEEFKSRMLFIWDTIKEEAMNIWNALVEGIASIVETIKAKFSPVLEKFEELKAKIMSVGEVIANSPVMEALSKVGDFLTAVLAPAISSIVVIVSGSLQTIWNVVVSVLNTIISIVGDILSGAIGVISGIIDVIVGLFTLDFGKILDGVGGILGSLLEMFMNIGGDLLNGFVAGVSAVVDGVVDTIAGVFTRIIDFVKDLLGIHSPSTVFAEIGENLMLGFVQGIQSLIDMVTGVFTTIKTTIMDIFNDMKQNISTAWKSIKNIFTNTCNGIKNTVTTIFTGIKNTISNIIDGAKNNVASGLKSIKGLFSGLKLELPKVKLPHFNVEGKLSITPPSVPKLSVDWYAKGGVFNQPSIIGVGEAGKEVVLPLERDTGWITILANEIRNTLSNTSGTQGNEIKRTISPISYNTSNANTTSNTITKGGPSSYFTTTNNTTNAPVEQKDDHSVTFDKGSIVIYATSMSETEAEKFANLIIEKVKQKQRVEKVMSYNQ